LTSICIKLFFSICFLFVFGCCPVNKKIIVTNKGLAKDSIGFWDDTTRFHTLNKLTIVGDFDGDDSVDTLIQHNYSKLRKAEIINAADPYKVDWDTVVQWFYNMHSDIYLSFNKPNMDSLHLGSAQDLYCLLNIGDINKDGKDDIAFVIDKCDFSNVNTCSFYTVCKGKWTLLKSIGIYEGAFEYETKDNRSPLFTKIKEYLEKHKGVWMYKNYPDEEYDNPEDVGKMKKLVLEKCK
jgi:hypothetical protein